MAEHKFSTLGMQEALKRLYDGTPFAPFKPAAHRVLLEGIDFNLMYFPLKHLGYKAVVGVTGELFARMMHPVALSLVLGVSAKLDYPQIQELWSGVVAAAKEYGYEDVSLSLQPSQTGLCISVSAEGKLKDLTRHSLPKPASKDVLCVSGRLGAAYLGLQVLERERVRFEAGTTKASEEMEKYKMLVSAYLHPELSSGIVKALEDEEIYPSGAVFITHGLADAVKRLSRATGLGAKVYADRIPFEGNSFELGKMLDIDPVSAAMNGGEDYQLLLSIPILQAEKFRREFQTWDIIGHLAQSDVGTVLVAPTGVELPLRAQGWTEAEDEAETNSEA
ncbi:MAG: thiamine-phosphate kinase [Candidatus Cryptobacteroides sp.]|jgi:thiamine-monophosphate kinase